MDLCNAQDLLHPQPLAAWCAWADQRDGGGGCTGLSSVDPGTQDGEGLQEQTCLLQLCEGTQHGGLCPSSPEAGLLPDV